MPKFSLPDPKPEVVLNFINGIIAIIAIVFIDAFQNIASITQETKFISILLDCQIIELKNYVVYEKKTYKLGYQADFFQSLLRIVENVNNLEKSGEETAENVYLAKCAVADVRAQTMFYNEPFGNWCFQRVNLNVENWNDYNHFQNDSLSECIKREVEIQTLKGLEDKYYF